jgi:hypothetical protein
VFYVYRKREKEKHKKKHFLKISSFQSLISNKRFLLQFRSLARKLFKSKTPERGVFLRKKKMATSIAEEIQKLKAAGPTCLLKSLKSQRSTALREREKVELKKSLEIFILYFKAKENFPKRFSEEELRKRLSVVEYAVTQVVKISFLCINAFSSWAGPTQVARAGIWKKLEAESTIASSAVKLFSPQVPSSHTAGGQVSTGSVE